MTRRPHLLAFSVRELRLLDTVCATGGIARMRAGDNKTADQCYALVRRFAAALLRAQQKERPE